MTEPDAQHERNDSPTGESSNEPDEPEVIAELTVRRFGGGDVSFEGDEPDILQSENP